jgi:death-on-curing protein
LLESLLINHPFLDGNKRVAFAACDVFLRLNGRYIQGDTARLYQRIMGWIAAAPADRFAAISSDLRDAVHTLP